MAPTGETITVSAPSDKLISAYPREYALFRQLDHSHKGQIPLQVRLHDVRDQTKQLTGAIPC